MGINPISVIPNFTYFVIVDIQTLKRNFVKENKKPFKAIKTTTKHKNLSQIYITGKFSEPCSYSKKFQDV